MYIDGNLVNSGVFHAADREGEIATSANDILIAQGNTGVGAQAFEGIIDEVAIFNSALTEDDINAIMTRGLEGAAAISPKEKLTTRWGDIKKLTK